MGGRWQELNAGRASARLGTVWGTQLKVLRLPGPARHREPLRPMGTTQGSVPIPAFLPTLARQFVPWLYTGFFSIQLKWPACWPP